MVRQLFSAANKTTEKSCLIRVGILSAAVANCMKNLKSPFHENGFAR